MDETASGDALIEASVDDAPASGGRMIHARVRAAAGPAAGTLVLALACFGADQLSQHLSFGGEFIATFYPPSAFVLAAMLLVPKRRWPLCLLAALLAQAATTLVGGGPLWLIGAFFAANAARELAAAFTLRYIAPTGCVFNSQRGVVAFVVVAVLAPALSAFLGAAIAPLNGALPPYWEGWRNWTLSNALAYLTLVPPLVSGLGTLRADLEARRPIHLPPRKRVLELGALLACLGLTSLATLGDTKYVSLALLYLPLPFVLWPAIRFGIGMTSFALLVMTSVVTADALHAVGPFRAARPDEAVLSVQLFLLVISLPMLFLAAIVRERRRAIEQLHESDRRYALATQAGRAYVFDGDARTRRLDVDASLATMLGADPRSLTTIEDWLRRVHPDDFATITAVRGEHGSHDPLAISELLVRVMHADGSVRWLAVSGSVMRDERGAPGRILGVATDVTARKLAELEADRQRDQLTHVSRVAAVGELATSLAHDISQPLLAILINAQVAARLAESEHPNLATVRDVVRDIVEDARHASDVVGGMRSFLRNEEPEHAPLELNAVLRQVALLVHGDGVRRQVTLALDLDPHLPPVVGDRVQLQQVVLNLLLNAFDAVAERRGNDGPREVVLRTARREGEIEVAVADNGPGIDEQHLKRLFEPFFTTKRSGLGMGLAICRSIVETHGGTVRATNNPGGRGATVAFSLPLPARLLDYESHHHPRTHVLRDMTMEQPVAGVRHLDQ